MIRGTNFTISGSLLFLLPLLSAQDHVSVQGANVFAERCATGYCHGPQGASGGGAPKLGGRGLTLQFIRQVVTKGNNEMPAFAGKLTGTELEAVIIYVGTLNGISPKENVAPETSDKSAKARDLLPEAANGRALFFEATRSFGRCSTCHRIDGNGIAVAAPIRRVPENADVLRALTTANVHTVKVGDQSFPALIAKSDDTETILYDLTSPPPVRRTFGKAQLEISDTSEWRHSSVIESYSSAEIESILLFLREIAARSN